MAVAGAHRSTNQRRSGAQGTMQVPRILLLLAVLSLLLIGLIMVYSASSVTALEKGGSASAEVLDQLRYVAVGIVAAFILWRFVPYNVWCGNFVYVVWAVALVLLIMTSAMGNEGFGAQRWLTIGPINLQPSEFVKIALVLMAVRIIYDFRSGMVEARVTLIQIGLFIIMPVLIIYFTQSDLGTTLICLVGIFAVMWLGGVNPRILGIMVVVGMLFMVFAIFGTGYRSGRMVYLDPWNDGEGGYGTGFNIIRSYYAFAEGGLFGVGLGNSREKFQYLFASDSDFIFAVIGEELGLVGALLVIVLFIVVLVCGLRIAALAPDPIGTMIAGGIITMLVFQAFLNIGCTIGVLPTTGKPLPFISSGGSSMIASLIMVGLVLSVSAAPTNEQRRRDDLRVVRVNNAPRR